MESRTADEAAFSPARRAFDLLVFLSIVGFSLAAPLLHWPTPQKVIVGAAFALPTAYLGIRRFRLFVPSLFFAINAPMSPLALALLRRFPFQFPQLYFLPSIILYLAISLSVPSLKRNLTWLRKGSFNRRTTQLVLVLVVGSAIALVGWTVLLPHDFSAFLQFVPKVGFPILLLYGIAFAIANSCFEEFLARAVLLDGFAALFNTILPVVIAQAVIFSIWHFNGFPGGPIGVGLIFIWSVFLGTIRHVSGGMMAPLIAHFFADSTISLILLFVLHLY